MGVCIPKDAVETDMTMGAGRDQIAPTAGIGGREEVIHLPDETLTGALGMWEDLSCRSSKEHLGFQLLGAVFCTRWAIDPT